MLNEHQVANDEAKADHQGPEQGPVHNRISFMAVARKWLSYTVGRYLASSAVRWLARQWDVV